MSCCLAWNISLFPTAEQEDHIERIWQMVEADNQETPPPGLEQGFNAQGREGNDQGRSGRIGERLLPRSQATTSP